MGNVCWICDVLFCFSSADYETLRALDADNVPAASMTEEEINSLPVHKYKVSGPQRSVLAQNFSSQVHGLFIIRLRSPRVVSYCSFVQNIFFYHRPLFPVAVVGLFV